MYRKLIAMSYLSFIVAHSFCHGGALFIASQSEGSGGMKAAGTQDSGFADGLGIMAPVSDQGQVVFISRASDFASSDVGIDLDVFIASPAGAAFTAEPLSLARSSFGVSTTLGRAKAVGFGGSNYVEVREDVPGQSAGDLLFWRMVSQSEGDLRDIANNFERFDAVRLSDNGRFLVIETNETGVADIYLQNLETAGSFSLISVKDNLPAGHTPANSSLPDISDSGKQVVFESADNGFVVNDTNGETDIFLWNNGAVQRINRRYRDLGDVNNLGLQTMNACNQPVISGDGNVIFFVSADPAVVSQDTNNRKDIFKYTVAGETTERINVFDTFFQGNDDSDEPDCDGSGRYVVFRSKSSNFPGARSGIWQIYLMDTATGKMECASLGTDGFGAATNCLSPAISPNGHYVTFSSNAANLTGSANEKHQVFLYDREGNSRPIGEMMSVSCSLGDGSMSISCPVHLIGQDAETSVENLQFRLVSLPNGGTIEDADGAVVGLNAPFYQSKLPLSFRPASLSMTANVSFSYQVFDGEVWSTPGTVYITAANFVPGLISATNRADSILANGNELANNSAPFNTVIRTDSVGMSGNGRWIAFGSQATNLTSEAVGGVFLRDTLEKRTFLLKEINASLIPFHFPVVSLDGSAVIFVDISNGLLSWIRISNGQSAGIPRTIPVRSPFHISISADGNRVVFDTFDALLPAIDTDRNANDPLDAAVGRDVYLWKPLTNEVVLVSQGNDATQQTAKSCIDPFISPDGQRVAFLTRGSFNGGDESGANDAVWVKYLSTGNIKRIADARGAMISPTLSWTGRYLAYDVGTSSVVLDLTKPVSNNLVKDISTSDNSYISPDGRYLYLTSDSTSFTLPDNMMQPTSGVQAYRYDLTSDTAFPLSLDSVNNFGNKDSFSGSLSEDGQFAVFPNNSTNFTVADNGFMNVFRMDLGPVANSVPTLADFTVMTPEDTATDIELPAVDAENNDLRYEIVSFPMHGVLGELLMPELEEGLPKIRYTSESNYVGSDTLAYRVKDAGGYSNTATITITVESVRDAPVLAVRKVWIFKGNESGTISRDRIDVTDVDYPDGIPDSQIELMIEQLPANGNLKLANGSPVQMSTPVLIADFPLTYTLNNAAESEEFKMDQILISAKDRGDAPSAIQSLTVAMEIFTGALRQDIMLYKGWNLISTSLSALDQSPEFILNCSGASSCIIGRPWLWNAVEQRMEIVTAIAPYQGFWIYAKQDGLLNDIPSRPLLQTTTNVSAGWNLVGPTGTEQERLLSDIDGRISGTIWNWDAKKQLFAVVDKLEAGNGYWLNSNGMIENLDLTLE